ncbi:MAG: MobA/MobL family protein [Alphaproteobacteria bacterium]|nr:MobA/MobL family protein [Alphaproteobacteria bacterium]
MAIYSLSHHTIGRSTHAAGTAGAHVAYITRGAAAREVLGERMPTTRAEARAWMEAQELAERKNGRVLDKVMIALPLELDQAQRAELVRDFAERATQGRASWLAGLHDRDRDANNPHAHLVIRDKDPQTGRRVAKLSEKGSTDRLRELWETVANEHLARAGIDARIDRRSLADQGVDRVPTIHEGVASVAMEARGLRPAPQVRQVNGREVRYPEIDQGTRGEINARVVTINAAREALRHVHTQTNPGSPGRDRRPGAEGRPATADIDAGGGGRDRGLGGRAADDRHGSDSSQLRVGGGRQVARDVIAILEAGGLAHGGGADDQRRDAGVERLAEHPGGGDGDAARGEAGGGRRSGRRGGQVGTAHGAEAGRSGREGGRVREAAATAAAVTRRLYDDWQDRRVRERFEVGCTRAQDGAETWGLWDRKARKWVDALGDRQEKLFGEAIQAEREAGERVWAAARAAEERRRQDEALRAEQAAQERREAAERATAEREEIGRLVKSVAYVQPGLPGKLRYDWDGIDDAERERREAVLDKHPRVAKAALVAEFKARDPQAHAAWQKAAERDRDSGWGR